jgi:hypothetical protein
MVQRVFRMDMEDLLVNVHLDIVVNDVKIVSNSNTHLLHGFLSLLLKSGDPCASQLCMNQGTCMQDNGGFRCVCPPGYSGIRCEIRDACQSNPCMNGGTCRPINGNGGYQCVCPSGFSGPRCETSTYIRYRSNYSFFRLNFRLRKVYN